MKRLVGMVMRLMGRRTCEDIVAILHDYHQGTLDPDLAAAMERHFRDCPGCRAFVRTYAETVRLTGELAAGDVPEDVRRRVAAALRERAAVARRSSLD